MRRYFTATFWSEKWTDLHCRLFGHIWSQWQDAHNGTYWRQCQDCKVHQDLPYIDLLVQQRQEKREEMRRQGRL